MERKEEESIGVLIAQAIHATPKGVLELAFLNATVALIGAASGKPLSDEETGVLTAAVVRDLLRQAAGEWAALASAAADTHAALAKAAAV